MARACAVCIGLSFVFVATLFCQTIDVSIDASPFGCLQCITIQTTTTLSSTSCSREIPRFERRSGDERIAAAKRLRIYRFPLTGNEALCRTPTGVVKRERSSSISGKSVFSHKITQKSNKSLCAKKGRGCPWKFYFIFQKRKAPEVFYRLSVWN